MNVITELGMSSNQVVGLMLIKMLVEIFFRPIAARVKLSVFDLCVGWSLAHLVQMSLYSFSSTFTYFAVGAVLFGIGNAFGHGLKLVLVIDCLGQQNLRPYLGRALDELNIVNCAFESLKVYEQLFTIPLAFFGPILMVNVADYFNDPQVVFRICLIGQTFT